MLQARTKFWGKKPGFDSGDLLHIGVNVGFAFFLGFLLLPLDFPVLRNIPFKPTQPMTALAVVLVLLSKWRVFAVQPRFWIPNIKANLVDVIVGVSTVGLMHQSRESAAAYVWVALYAAWLLFVKPRSSALWISTQAIWAQTIGLVMLFGSTDLVQHAVVVSVLAWVVTWASARHYFSNYDEPHYRALSLLWAFVNLQIVWYALHWIQYYTIGGLLLSTVAIYIAIISLTLGSLYHAYKNDKLTRNLIIENTVLSVISAFALLISSGWRPTL